CLTSSFHSIAHRREAQRLVLPAGDRVERGGQAWTFPPFTPEDRSARLSPSLLRGIAYRPCGDNRPQGSLDLAPTETSKQDVVGKCIKFERWDKMFLRGCRIKSSPWRGGHGQSSAGR